MDDLGGSGPAKLRKIRIHSRKAMVVQVIAVQMKLTAIDFHTARTVKLKKSDDDQKYFVTSSIVTSRGVLQLQK